MTPTNPTARVASRSCGEPLDAIHVDEFGPTARYYEWRLERKRRWNIGLRRHAVELTGRIEVINPVTRAYRVVGDWDAARKAALDFHKQVETAL